MTKRSMAWLTVVLFACGSHGGTPSPNSDAGPDPDPQLGTGAAGIVVANADGTFGIAQSVASGAHAVPSADVRLVGLRGNEMAHGTTAADGRFALILASGTTADKAAIEVRMDANATAPDLSFPVSFADGVTIPAGAVFAVTRDQAIQSIVPLATPASLIAGTFNPLPAGAIVAPAFGDENSVMSPALAHTVAAEGEYLFLIDPTPTAFWGHVVEYDLVNASTGAVTRMPGQNWLPSVNSVLLFSYTDELVDGSNPPPTSGPIAVSGEAIQLPDESMTMPMSMTVPMTLPMSMSMSMSIPTSILFAAPGPNPQAPLVSNPQDIFGFIIVGTPEDWFVADGNRMKDWLTSQLVPAGNIVVSSPVGEEGFNRAAKVRADFERVAALILARKQMGGCPTLFVYVASHSNPKGQILLADTLLNEGIAKLIGAQQFINIDDLIPLQLVPAAAKVRVLIQSCFGAYHVARMKAAVEALPSSLTDVEVYTASGTGRASGNSRLHNLIKAFHPSGIPEFISNSNPLNDVYSGGEYTKRWIGSASMDDSGDLILPPLTFVFNQGDTGPQKYKKAGGPPIFTSVSPNGGVAGDLVTITGMHLGGPGTNVLFNGISATVISGDDSMLVVKVPASTTGKIEVDGCCPSVSPADFLYVTSGVFAPTHGLPGTKVVIPGTGLGGPGAFVKFGTHLVTVDPSSTDTLLTVTVPVGAGDQNAFATLGGSAILVLSGQDTIGVTNNGTGPFVVGVNVTFTFTNTNGGANTTVGQTEVSTATIYGAGAGVDGNLTLVTLTANPFGSPPGTLGTGHFSAGLLGGPWNDVLDFSGMDDAFPSTMMSMTLSGMVGPDGTGSGDGMVTRPGLTITFSWTSTPR